MNITQKGIIILLKSSITQKAFPLPDEFDLEQALPLIRCHNISTLAYDGAVRCGISRQHPAMQQLFQDYCMALIKSEKQMEEINRIFKIFEENGIEYMPLKGSKMKALYPRPELRVMGDADILIRMEQYEKIKSLMTVLGFRPAQESDHELVWKSDALYLELHKRIIPSYNKDFYAYFGDGWQWAVQEDGNRYGMPIDTEWTYLFTHFAKHYRDGGIGCRHLTDLWVYLKSTPDLDEVSIKAELNKLHLLEFYKNVRRLMEVWFEDGSADEKTDYMTDYIFASGNWGNIQTRAISRTVRDSKHTGRNTKIVFLKKTLFPNAKILTYEFPVLKKAPVLLPFCWIIRLIRKFLFQHRAVERGIKGLRTVSDTAVDERQRMLRYVGLDYHF